MMPYRNEDIDQLASSYGKDLNPDVEAALSAVQQRIHAAEGGVVRQLPPRRRWLGIAAAALLLVTATYFGLFHNPDVVLANNGDAPLELQLPDGTSVVLQKGATVTYAADYGDTERRLALSGQAYFAVHKDKTRPFLVSNDETELRVTGTAFNLRVEDNELEVEVAEGSVELRKGDQVVPVGANQCGTSERGKPSVVRPAPHLNRHAWRTGKLYFQSVSLPEVLKTLEANFGMVVTVDNNCDFPVSGTYAADNPLAILRNVVRLGNGTVEPVAGTENTYRITGACE